MHADQPNYIYILDEKTFLFVIIPPLRSAFKNVENAKFFPTDYAFYANRSSS